MLLINYIYSPNVTQTILCLFIIDTIDTNVKKFWEREMRNDVHQRVGILWFMVDYKGSCYLHLYKLMSRSVRKGSIQSYFLL